MIRLSHGANQGLRRDPQGKWRLRSAPLAQGGLLRPPCRSKELAVAPSAQSGFSLLFVLFAIVLVGLSMMGANKQWTTMMKREREAELLFRGDQYRRAIGSYTFPGSGGARQYPPRVDDLIKDPRNSKRHLRTAYTDPITGGPFYAVPCQGDTNRFKGVYSSSDALTLKHDNFPSQYEQFRSAATYREWIFQYEESAQQQTAPDQKTPPASRPPLPAC